MALLDGRAVLLIRNPYEAAVSAFTHWALADHASVRTLAFLGRAIDCAKFRDKAKEVVRRWENIATDFLTMGTRILVVHFEVWTEFTIPIPIVREISSCFVLGVPLPCLGSS